MKKKEVIKIVVGQKWVNQLVATAKEIIQYSGFTKK
jgi:hypothetical protein